MFSLKRFVPNARWFFNPVFRGISSKDLVDLSVDVDGIGVLTIRHPPVNTMSLPVLHEICKSLDEVARNKYTGMVLTSSSPKIFSAGLDIMELYKPDPIRLEHFILRYKRFGSSCLEPTSLRLLLSMLGHSPAGGCLLALCCEHRTMVDGPYRIGLNEIALGIVVPPWASYTMSNVISQRESELALTTARMFTVDEARKVGLIDEIATDKADAIEKCKEFIRKVAFIPSVTRANTKQRLRQTPLEWMKRNRKEDFKKFVSSIQTPEVQSFIESYIQRLKQKSTMYV